MKTTPLALVIGALTLSSTLHAQSVMIDMAGMQIRSGDTDFRDSGANTLPAASGYSYSIDAEVVGNGIPLSLFFGTPRPIADVLDEVDPGGSRLLNGFVRNPSNSLPSNVYLDTFTGTLVGFDVNFTFQVSLDAAGVGSIQWFDVNIPLTFGSTIDALSGTTTISTWMPPQPVATEFRFDGNFNPVANSGPALIRYLDDPAFGPPLEPTVNAPSGVTAAQSAFGTTTSFGIADINGTEATVYQTSPTRNLTTPADPTLARGIGLLLWPKTADFWPEDKIGQWTLVTDVYIPSASWNAPSGVPLSIIETNHNNEEEGDLVIANPGGGMGAIGFGVDPADRIVTSAIGPDRWMRIAVVCDQYQAALSRIFVDGTFIGTSDAAWLYNGCDHTNPTYADAEAIAPADWTAWGEFPNPWAMSSGLGASGMPVPVASTMCLFSDRLARAESCYVANLMFTDDLLTDTAVADLGAPDAAGILLTNACAVDLDGDGDADVFDLLDYLSLWFVNDPEADLDGVAGISVFDLLEFLSAWFEGC